MEMTREEFMSRVLLGAAAISLADSQENLTATEEKLEGDFVTITGRRNGKLYGLGYELEGDEKKDLQGIKWLHRSHELWYKGAGVDALYPDKIWRRKPND